VCTGHLILRVETEGTIVRYRTDEIEASEKRNIDIC